MKNESILPIKVMEEHYQEFARLNNQPTESVTMYTGDCEILSPHVDVAAVKNAKEKYMNSRAVDSNFKAAVIYVPMLIVYEN